MTDPQYSRLPEYYDEVMQSVPYGFWIRYVLQLAARYKCQPRSILDLACGTGSLSIRLAQMGYDVEGADLSAGMIAQARRRAEAAGLDLRLEVQDAASLQMGRTYDLVISLYDSLNYITDEQALQACFQAVYHHLNPGGLFIFDMNTAYAFAEGLFDQRGRGHDRVLLYDWRSRYDAQTGICEVDCTFRVRPAPELPAEEFQERHIERAYPIADLKAWLEQAGFDRVRAFNSYTKQAPSSRSDRVHFVAAKWGDSR